MQSSEDRQESVPGSGAVARPGRRISASPNVDRYTDSVRTAPRGPESRIGDDETHRRLQEARNRARHSTEDMIRRELGPEWV